MTKQEIIDAFDVALRLRQLVELVASEEARCEMVSAAETIIGSLTDDDEAIDIILQALKTPAADPQLRELIEENGRLKRELDAAAEREAKMMVRIAELTTEPIEEEPDPDEEDEPEPVEAKPEKKKRAYHGNHKWTQTEDDWIANHLNSATSRDVAEKFGVSPKAAYTRMLLVKERLGK